MLGKTFKGMTDEMLAWQTGLLELETRRESDASTSGRSSSSRSRSTACRRARGIREEWPRFARVKGYRPDESPEEADSDRDGAGRPMTGAE